MFRYKSVLLLLLVSAAALVSCQPKEEEKSYSIKLSDPNNSTLTYESGAVEQNISFTSSQPWSATAESGTNWVSVSPASGEGGKSSIKVSVSANDTEESRNTVIKLSSGSASQNISISQAAKSVLQLEQNEFSVGADACSITVKVLSNIDYTVSVDSESSWISLEGTKASVESSFVLNIQKNDSYNSRVGKVKVNSEKGLSAAITVSQSSLRTTVFDESKVVLSLGVVSDVHINNGYQDGGEITKWMNSLKQLKSKASILDSDGLDGVLVDGDLIDLPNDSFLASFKSTYESVFPDPTAMPMIYTIGNHDVPGYAWASSMVSDSKYIRTCLGDKYFTTDLEPENGTAMECRNCKIGDYHILCISPNGDSPITYDSKAVAWLDETLGKLIAEDPNRYVIVLTHPMIASTVYGSRLGEDDGIWYSTLPHYWASSVLTSVLKKYPQAVVFGGHLHFPINDPRTIWQGDFTCAGTASVRYMAIENGGYQNMATTTTMNDRAKFSQGYLVQFDKSGNMRINRMDFYNSTTIGSNWEIQYPDSNKSNLHKYNHDELKAANNAPVLTALNAPDYENISDVVVSWPSGEDDEFVHHYILTLKSGSTTLKTLKYLTDFYLCPQPSDMKKTWEVNLGTLDIGSYSVTLEAYDSWDAKAVLTKDFKVEKAKPADLALYADVDFSNGSISDRQNNLTITNKNAVVGSKTVSHNGKNYTVNCMTASAGKYVVCQFNKIASSTQMKTFASGNFTVEAFYVDAAPSSSIHGIICGTEYGGWGLATAGSNYSNKPYFVVGSGATSNVFKSVYAKYANSTTELTHVIAVYDYFNQNIRIYINGVLDNTASISIPFFPGTGDAYNRFCIGNDIKQNNTGGDFPCSNATIVRARIYRGAMTDSDAATAYSDAVKALGN